MHYDQIEMVLVSYVGGLYWPWLRCFLSHRATKEKKAKVAQMTDMWIIARIATSSGCPVSIGVRCHKYMPMTL